MIRFIKDKKLLDKIKDPLAEFVKLEAFSGIVLMTFTVLAILIANSNVGTSFINYWNNYFGIEFNNWELNKTLLHWINDGLMAIFFFVVGLEIKRELLTGGLSSIKKASLPIFGAVGGMLIPALIYISINCTGEHTHGWGIPMATDIAFALGILILLGKKIPLSLKLLLTSIAIVDDIGAVIVIALYYTKEIQIDYLFYALYLYAGLWLLNYLKIRNVSLYLIIGIVLWYMFLKSGVHATLAGILLAFTIPARANCNVFQFSTSTKKIVDRLEKNGSENGGKVNEKHIQSSVSCIEDNCVKVISPLIRLEHAFHPWVAYIIVPIFAFANAGVIIDSELTSYIFEPISLGIILGLFLGKPLGIFLFSFLAVKFKFAQKNKDILWSHILGVGFLGGIGFTMSFFVSQLAFESSTTSAISKFAILIASLLSGIVGFVILKKIKIDKLT